jgi:hypothetical protein
VYITESDAGRQLPVVSNIRGPSLKVSEGAKSKE